MTSPNLRIGTVGYPLPKAKIHKYVDAIELNEGRNVPPRVKTARKWRKEAPDRIAFTVQMSEYLFATPPAGCPLEGELSRYGGFCSSDENLGLWQRGLEFAEAMDAQSLVLLTPAQFTPSKPNRNALEALLAKAPRGDLPLVWSYSGPWDFEQACAFARDLGMVVAVDPLRDTAPRGPLAYFRLGPFSAMGSRMGVYDLERIALAADEYEATLCLFDTPRPLDDVRNLKKVIADRDEGGWEEDDQDELF